MLPNIGGNIESSAESEELEIGEFPQMRSSDVLGWWKERGRWAAKGSNGSSSSSSSGRIEDRKLELGVPERERYVLSDVRGAAIASFEVGREGGAQRSGEGVSPRKAANDPGLEEAAERGRGMGLNSEALALRSRGEDMGDEGRLTANWACVIIGEWPGDSLRAAM